MDIITQKKCGGCGEVKSVNDFYNSPRNKKDGKAFQCKVCMAKTLKKWRRDHPEQAHAQVKKWAKENWDYIIQKAKRWQKANPEKVRAMQKRYQETHREQSNIANRKSVAKHADKVRERKRKYRAANPDKTLVWTNNRRTRLLCNGEKVEVDEWTALKEFYGNKCLCCERSDLKLTMDHVMPVSMGGRNLIENIQPLCGSCNSRKNNKTIDYR